MFSQISVLGKITSQPTMGSDGRGNPTCTFHLIVDAPTFTNHYNVSVRDALATKAGGFRPSDKVLITGGVTQATAFVNADGEPTAAVAISANRAVRVDAGEETYVQGIVVGHMGGDPEASISEQDGTFQVRTSIADSTRYTKPDGTKGERTTWYTVFVRGKQGEALSMHGAKGQGLAVVGSVSANAYVASDGKLRASINLNAFRWNFVGGKPGNKPTTPIVASKTAAASLADIDGLGF